MSLSLCKTIVVSRVSLSISTRLSLNPMSIFKSFAFVATCLLSTSCCSIPSWLGGRQGCELFMPNLASPAENGVVISLCSSGDVDSEAGIRDLRIDEFEEALKRFMASSTASPEKNANTLFLIAVTLERLGRYEEARKAYCDVCAVAVHTPAEAGAKRAQHKHERWSRKP